MVRQKNGAVEAALHRMGNDEPNSTPQPVEDLCTLQTGKAQDIERCAVYQFAPALQCSTK